MNLLNNRSILALGAVVDIALHGRSGPVAANALSRRLRLSPRHLETTLQALVHARVLKGVRGPRGGYMLARNSRQITAGEIVRIERSLSKSSALGLAEHSVLLDIVIEPSVVKAGEPFLANLDAITVEQLCDVADAERILEGDQALAA